jgi:hypothetical protein
MTGPIPSAIATMGVVRPTPNQMTHRRALAVETGVLPHLPEKSFLVASPVDGI